MEFKQITKISAYDDSFNQSQSEGILETSLGYRYRLIDGVMMPPYVTPECYAQSRSIEIRPGDVCFCSFPKSGSTWLSQIVLLLLHGGTNPDEGTLRQHMIWAATTWPFPKPIEEVNAMPSPRVFKSHMPYSMAVGGEPHRLPSKNIYIARNPKDVCVSYFHFETGKAWAGSLDCGWDEWFELFMAGEIQRGNWFDHVLGWWEYRDADNMLFLKYEDMLFQNEQQIRLVADFLEIDLPTDMLEMVMKHSAFDHMKNNEFANMHEVEQLDTFYRRGKVGTWKEHFSEGQNQRFESLIESRLGGSGLDFMWVPTE